MTGRKFECTYVNEMLLVLFCSVGNQIFADFDSSVPLFASMVLFT